MMTSNLDPIDSLGALIGFGAPVASATPGNFAEMMSAATTAQADAALPAGISSAQEPVTEPAGVDSTAIITLPPPAMAPSITCTVTADPPAAVGNSQPSALTLQPVDAIVDQTEDGLPLAEAPPTLTADAAPPMNGLVAVSSGPEPSAPENEADIQPKRRTVALKLEKPVYQSRESQMATAAPVVLEAAKPATRLQNDMPDVAIAPLVEARSTPVSLQLPTEKPAVALPDRLATFAPVIADAVRDLVILAQDKNVRFNVRPEVLGLVAVTIERDAAGPTLRLGVETQAAVQAVRQAETLLNDPRGNVPFVQVTVDLNAPDQRGRSARVPMSAKRRPDDVATLIENRTPLAVTGRYA